MVDRSFTEIREYLHSIDGIHAEKSMKGEEVWYLRSGRTQHLQKMIVEQKPARVPLIKQLKRQSNAKSCVGDSAQSYSNACYYKDNYAYRQKMYGSIYEVTGVRNCIHRRMFFFYLVGFTTGAETP